MGYSSSAMSLDVCVCACVLCVCVYAVGSMHKAVVSLVAHVEKVFFAFAKTPTFFRLFFFSFFHDAHAPALDGCTTDNREWPCTHAEAGCGFKSGIILNLTDGCFKNKIIFARSFSVAVAMSGFLAIRRRRKEEEEEGRKKKKEERRKKKEERRKKERRRRKKKKEERRKKKKKKKKKNKERKKKE